MRIDRTSKIVIRLSGEETALLRNALTLLQSVDKEINNPDVDEVEFDCESDKGLMEEMFNELDEICCTF
jgi:hypothetical protein